MLDARDISLTLDHKTILHRVSLQVRPGELVALLGANGAGKSSLLKTLADEYPPSRGEVRLNGRPLNHWRKREQALMRAVMPQTTSLTFPFTALEVALMGRTPKLQGAESADDYRIAAEALALTDSAHLAERLYPSLSGGEQQRVQLARVLAQIWEESALGPRFLLLDECTASLDPAHQHQVFEVVRQFVRQGVGVLAILHDLNLAAQYADRILLLKQGRLLALGTPREVLTERLIGEAYELEVAILPHPRGDWPLVVPLGAKTKTRVQLTVDS